jgi:uncharacterized membrane protein YkvA (DUF1232 family)
VFRQLLSAPKWARMLYHLPNYTRLFLRLWHDPRVPVYRKAIPVLSGFVALMVGLAYVAMKLDLIPDFLPFIGKVDDIVIVLALLFAPGAWIFIRMCPPAVVAEHVAQIDRSRRDGA